MAYKIKFTKSAAEDLKAIQKYICQNNKEAAKKVIAHILDNIEKILPENPAAGRAGRVLRTRELVISKYPYIVPYQARDNIIYILRILPTSKKWLS